MTFGFIICMAIVTIVYDVMVAWRWGSSATISWTFAVVSRRWPIVSFLFAAVMGHVFLVRWGPNILSVENVMAAAPLILGLVIGATMAAQKPDPQPAEKDRGDD